MVTLPAIPQGEFLRVAAPFIAKAAMKNQSGLLGAVALLSTLIGLIVTTWLATKP